MKYLSLFSGYEGFELGIQQAYGILDNQLEVDGLQTEKDSSSNIGDTLQRTPLCVGFSEIDKYAT